MGTKRLIETERLFIQPGSSQLKASVHTHNHATRSHSTHHPETAENSATVASGAEERGGARAQPGHVLIFRHSSRFVLICMHVLPLQLHD